MPLFRLKIAVVALSALGIAACNSEGNFSNDGSVNTPPVAEAGAPQTVDEFSSVTLSGSASDSDGDVLSYRWELIAGHPVAITSSASLTAGFDAPDVTALDASLVMTFRLTVDDGKATASDTVDITVIDAGLGTNTPPTADIRNLESVTEFVTVELDGSGSTDPDGDPLSYRWTQTQGPSVTVLDRTSARASFISPDVAPGSVVLLTFELAVSDGQDTTTVSATIEVAESLSQVTVAGRLTYERPATNFRCRGFDFSDVTLMPVRLATVRLLDASNTVLAESKTDDDGNYAFSNVPANTTVKVRVRAELLQTNGPQRWQVYVRDNTAETSVPLDKRPIYAVDFGAFDSGVVNIDDADFTATTGWPDDAYYTTRAAAPLAILDAILDGVMLVTSVDPDVDMGRLDAFWSVNNSYSQNDDPDNGEVVTAYYTSNPEFPDDATRNPSLFLRGDAIGRFATSIIDTDEFDRYVILHEWGHFFEDQLSRSDSIGGTHYIPGTVEARVAFGEGWGNAIGGIVGDPMGCDTGEPSSSGTALDMENFDSFSGEQGFFNEMSVATFLYDLWDTLPDGADNDSIGFAPIYNTMTGFQKNTEAFTTIFSFATGLRQNVDPVDIAFIDAQLERENIDTIGLDIWASNQATKPTNWDNGKPVRDLLPLYTELTPGGPAVNLCVNDDQVRDQDGNKPGEWRYLYFTLNGQQNLTLTAQANPLPPPTSDTRPGARDRADPEMYLYRGGALLADSRSPDDDREIFDMPALGAGTYTVAFQDWRYEDGNTPDDPDAKASDYPSQVCFDFTLN
jgi:hypothetical protein